MGACTKSGALTGALLLIVTCSISMRLGADSAAVLTSAHRLQVTMINRYCSGLTLTGRLADTHQFMPTL